MTLGYLETIRNVFWNISTFHTNADLRNVFYPLSERNFAVGLLMQIPIHKGLFYGVINLSNRGMFNKKIIIIGIMRTFLKFQYKSMVCLIAKKQVIGRVLKGEGYLDFLRNILEDFLHFLLQFIWSSGNFSRRWLTSTQFSKYW